MAKALPSRMCMSQSSRSDAGGGQRTRRICIRDSFRRSEGAQTFSLEVSRKEIAYVCLAPVLSRLLLPECCPLHQASYNVTSNFKLESMPVLSHSTDAGTSEIRCGEAQRAIYNNWESQEQKSRFSVFGWQSSLHQMYSNPSILIAANTFTAWL